MSDLDVTLERLRNRVTTRFVFYGSSNTSRNSAGAGRYNWGDWLDHAVRLTYGFNHRSVNSGVSGDTTRGLLERFDDDVALFSPHAVIVTIGGNDSSPKRDISEDEFRRNLGEVVDRVRALPECVPFLQTYYSVDTERMGPGDGAIFHRYMDIVRDVAREKGVFLVDHMARWERLREASVEDYRRMMYDTMHLNPLGNMVQGLDLVRLFQADVGEVLEPHCAEGREIQKWLDDLEAAERQRP